MVSESDLAAETVMVKPLEIDESPTIMIPATSIGFPPDDEDNSNNSR